MGFDPKEVATLIIGGQMYRDWTSVDVVRRYTEWFPSFQFDCTEFDDMKRANPSFSMDAYRSNIRIKPGDKVQVLLGGQLAVEGYVTERHVGYDANNHGVRIVGVGKSFDLTNTSVIPQTAGSYDGKNWEQIARAILGPTGVGLKILGKLDAAVFERAHILPAEVNAAVLERYARMRKIIIGSTPFGEVLAVGEHQAISQDTLQEGGNIKAANAVLKDDNVYKKIYALGSKPGSDNSFGDDVNKMVESVDGSSTRNRYLVVPSDVADGEHGLQQRARMQLNFTDGLELVANIVVQGWLRQNGQLWKDGDYYFVNSPMLILNDLLGCKEVTFHQSNAAGTISTLVMVDPSHMNGKPNMSGSTPNTTPGGGDGGGSGAT